MQLKGFHWPRHHGLGVIIPCSTYIVSVHVIFLTGGVLFNLSVLYIGGVVNKTSLLLARFGYEMIKVKKSEWNN